LTTISVDIAAQSDKLSFIVSESSRFHNLALH